MFGSRDEGSSGYIEIHDPAAERNDIEVTTGDGQILIRERGPAPLTEDADCARVAYRVVTCSFRSTVHASLGAGDDELRFDTDASFFSVLDGEAGDDLIRPSRATDGEVYVSGQTGDDTLFGSPGPDQLHGGSGEDRLRAGAGDDLVQGDRGTAWSDVLDGGRGHDTASWRDRDGGVRVDLSRGLGGRRGERDTLRSIESAAGGAGNDHLVGDGRANRLRGGAGADVMVGAGGGDVISGGLYNGGPDGWRDRISCGGGLDEVRGASVRGVRGTVADALPQGCERHRLHSTVPVPRLAVGMREVRLVITCGYYDGASAKRCRSRATLHSGGTVLGRSATRRITNRGTLTVKLEEPLRAGPAIDVVVERKSRLRGEWRPRYLEFRLRRPTAAARAR